MEKRKFIFTHSWNDVSVNIQTKKVANELSKNNQVLFITQSRIGQPSMQINENFKVIEWLNKRPTSFKDLVFIYKLMKKEKPDVAIMHFGGTNNMMIAAWLLGIKKRIGWMHTLTEQTQLDVKSKWKAKWHILKRSIIYKLATDVIVLNEYGRKDAIDNYHIAAKKLFKIYNGIEDPKRRNENDGTHLSIRYLGRLDVSKGVDILLEAFIKIAEQLPNALLELVGKGDLKEALEDKVKMLGLEQRVIFHPPITDYKKVFDFMCGAYCIVVPSRMDNFPTVVLECLATATPVIAAKTGGIPEMIDDEENGLLFERESVADLTAKLLALMSNASKRKSIATAARKKFEEQFEMERHVEQVIQYLKQL